jgi:hypothetical protein
MLLSMHSSTTLAPSPNAAEPNLDSFAAFLEKLTQVDVSDAVLSDAVPALPMAALDDDVESLSYEHALRRRPAGTTAAAAGAALAVQPAQVTSLATTEKLNARASFRLTAQERGLVQQRAAESSLSVSAYIRSCVLEVEMLRAQVKQLVSEVRESTAMSPRIVAEEMPVIAAPRKQTALPSPMQTRQLKPAMTREPQLAPARPMDSRVQAAVEAQKRLAAEQGAQSRQRTTETRSGLLGFFFGARKTA